MKRDAEDIPRDAHKYRARTIGTILVATGKLDSHQVRQIVDEQQQCGLRFGDVGIALGLVTPEGIRRALAQQHGYSYLVKGESKVSDKVFAAYDPFGSEAEALRWLRSKIRLQGSGNKLDTKVISICSPSKGEGRSYLAANLAVVFSQLGERTLLIDADMRKPVQHTHFGLHNGVGLSSILAGNAHGPSIHTLSDFIELSILTAGPTPPNPQELLSSATFGRLVEQARASFDVVIIDTSPAQTFADALAVAARAGTSLLVARKNVSTATGCREVAELLRGAGVSLLGSVLTQF